MAFKDAKDALSWLSKHEICSGRFGLHRMEFIMDHLGNPQNDIPCVLIGGTNGKGSVTVILESIIASTEQYLVGSTISPHLTDARERIRIQGKFLPAEYWLRGIDALPDIVKVMERESSLEAPSFFELMTALAFWAFRETDRDIAVIEVGLGGRLDATNVSNPEVSIITNIGTDHQDMLGPDRPSIAREKLGILRRKRTLVTGEKDPRILEIFSQACKKIQTKLVTVETHDNFHCLESNHKGHTVEITGIDEKINYPLAGMHQLENLSVALATIDCLRANRFDIPPEAVKKGIESVVWPGRLQWFDGNPPILIDGAHNNEGLHSLLDYLDRFPMPRPCHLILGALQKKPVAAMADLLASKADSLSFVAPTCLRALKQDDFKALVLPTNSRWQWHENLNSALDAGKNSASILVTGSLYLIADFLRLRSSTS